MRTIIHVNQHVIKANRRDGVTNPPLTVKTYKGNRYCSSVVIKGDSEVVYRPNDPLSCGAHVWIQTQAPVELVGEVT